MTAREAAAGTTRRPAELEVLAGTAGVGTYPDVAVPGAGHRLRRHPGAGRPGPDDDTLKGGGGKDRLLGQGGRDALKAGSGKADVCRGGGGRDRLRGCEK
ncbi:MAG: hypothetical protein ACRDJP_13510 [Actinomycetota bacterium]